MYDPACETLARYFLGDLATERLAIELAQHIQDEIESWLETERDKFSRRLAQQP